MEKQHQHPEFSNNLENFPPCICHYDFATIMVRKSTITVGMK